MTGAAGNIGATGPQGPQGPAGINGTNGVDGATGSTGPVGLVGPAGLTGPTGANGAIGATGPAGTLAVGAVTGPNSSILNAIVVWNDTIGRSIKTPTNPILINNNGQMQLTYSTHTNTVYGFSGLQSLVNAGTLTGQHSIFG